MGKDLLNEVILRVILPDFRTFPLFCKDGFLENSGNLQNLPNKFGWVGFGDFAESWKRAVFATDFQKSCHKKCHKNDVKNLLYKT